MGLMAALRGHGAYRGERRGAIDGANIWWVAPTYGVGAKIWRDLKKACHAGWSGKWESDRRIELPGGGCIVVKSADAPAALRGEGLDGLIVDEAAYMRESVWRDALRPALSDAQGWTIFTSTPNGRNWFYKLFEAAQEENEWQRWQLPTNQNPLVPGNEFAAARREMGARAFAQEYLARFVETQGAEFSGAYFHQDIWFDHWPPDNRIRWRVMALDPSKGGTERSDYSAFVMVALDDNGVMWVDADLKRRDPVQIVADGLRLAHWFQPDAFGVEVNQYHGILAGIFAERSKTEGMMLPLHGIRNHENKVTRIRATLTPYLARGEFRFQAGSPGAKLLVEQLAAFPLDKHDDGPDALEMAVRLLRHVFEFGPNAHHYSVERIYT